MKRKPTGHVAVCQCGVIVGAIDYAQADRIVAGKVLGRWIAEGCIIQPRFAASWSCEIYTCKCEEKANVAMGVPIAS